MSRINKQLIVLTTVLFLLLNSRATWAMPIVQPKRQVKQFTLMILVSFSMPMLSIRRYVVDSQRIGGIVVLRGLVNNSLSATARQLHEVIQGVNGGIAIDSIVFEKLSITKVPAIVLFNPAGVACLHQPHCIPSDDEYAIVYGNVTLEYALRLMANGEQATGPLAKHLLQQLREENDDVAMR